MAEKYGTIPPKFTKEWWAYFWEYYKWHCIITAGVIACVLVTVVQCATRIEYDLSITYAGDKIYTDEQVETFKNLFTEYVEDVDGDGKNIFFQQINFSDAAGYEEHNYASQTKLDLTAYDDYSYIFILGGEELGNMLDRDYVSEFYMPVSDWYTGSLEGKDVYENNGTAYAVSIKDSAVLKENSLYNDNAYIVIRQQYKDDEKSEAAFESSKRIANAIME